MRLLLPTDETVLRSCALCGSQEPHTVFVDVEDAQLAPYLYPSFHSAPCGRICGNGFARGFLVAPPPGSRHGPVCEACNKTPKAPKSR